MFVLSVLGSNLRLHENVDPHYYNQRYEDKYVEVIGAQWLQKDGKRRQRCLAGPHIVMGAYVCGTSGLTVAHRGTSLQLPSSHQQNHNTLCASQRGKRHCKTEDSCFHNRTNCTLHHRTKLVVKTVIKTDRQWNMTHLGTAASQAHCHWPLFKNSHLHFWIVNI